MRATSPPSPGHLPQSVVVTLSGASGGEITLPDVFDLSDQLATVNLNVTDSSASSMPARITILGMDPDGDGSAPKTPDPTLGKPPVSDTAGSADPRAEGTENVVFLTDGSGSVQLAPGAYQFIASRGIEYSADRFPVPGASSDFVMLAAGQTININLQLSRLLDSDSLPAGAGPFVSPFRRHIAADFHVRTGGSSSAAVPGRDVLISALANGIEHLVTTDSDQVTDLGADLANLDNETPLMVGSMLATGAGVQTTGSVPVLIPGTLEFANTIGQFNAWPLTRDPALRRNGAPADEYRPPSLLFDQLRALSPPSTVIQMNQPRFPVADEPLPPVGRGFFTNNKAGFPVPAPRDPSAEGYEFPLLSSGGMADLVADRTLTGATSRYIDFDALEIYSGSIETYELSRLDWYALLSAGLIKTATAKSPRRIRFRPVSTIRVSDRNIPGSTISVA